MATATKPRLKPQAAIGQPYVPPAPRPPVAAPASPGAMSNATLRIPESVTAYGDQTGKPYLRMGDNPYAPETVRVTPQGQPGATAIMGNGAVSMAGGGYAIVGAGGGGGLSATDQLERQNLLLRQQENARIIAAQNDVGDQSATGMAQTLQASEDYKYGAAGVAQPQSIYNASNTALAPGTRSAILSNEDIARRDAGQAQTMRADALSLARFDESARGGSQIAGGPQAVNPNRQQPLNNQETRGETRGSRATMADPKDTIYRDPKTGQDRKVTPQQKQQLEAKDRLETATRTQDARKDADFAKAQRKRGLVPYQSAMGGEEEWLTPAEASLRKAQEPVAYRDPSGRVSLVSPEDKELLSANEDQLYRDPKTGKARRVDPAEKIRLEAQDRINTDQAKKQQNAAGSRYPNLGTGDIVQAASKGQMDHEEAKAELALRYRNAYPRASQQEIDIMVNGDLPKPTKEQEAKKRPYGRLDESDFVALVADDIYFEPWPREPQVYAELVARYGEEAADIKIREIRAKAAKKRGDGGDPGLTYNPNAPTR